jgi:hypothetical protein
MMWPWFTTTLSSHQWNNTHKVKREVEPTLWICRFEHQSITACVAAPPKLRCAISTSTLSRQNQVPRTLTCGHSSSQQAGTSNPLPQLHDYWRNLGLDSLIDIAAGIIIWSWCAFTRRHDNINCALLPRCDNFIAWSAYMCCSATFN